MDVDVYIGETLTPALRCVRLTQSYVDPWTAELAYDGRHDAYPCQLYDWVFVREHDSGEFLFRGNVTEIEPRGVDREGIQIVARCRRWRLRNEPVNINGSGTYCWNRRGTHCEYESGEDSPGQDGGPWTCGEIAVDIIEHALDIPAGGSAIPGHHSSAGCVTDAYLSSLDIVSYTPADWLALDSVPGEFCVNATSVEDALSMLVEMNGGFYGWFIDAYGVLRLVDMSECAAVSIAAGELGHWQDEAGQAYDLVDNRLGWTLEGVCSRVVVQGTDRTVEVKPANLDGCANAALNGGGQMELLGAPWKDYPCAYRVIDQPNRRMVMKPVGWTGSCEGWRTKCECGVPAGVNGVGSGPRIYVGTAAGAKAYIAPPSGAGSWRVNLITGVVMFSWDVEATLAPGESLWMWGWARRPFTVEAGPDGTAYDCVGFERKQKHVDAAFRHTTSWPYRGTADDETAMTTLAGRLLEQVQDIRIQGRVSVDGIDPGARDILRRYSMTNLTAPAGGPCSPDPMDWAHLDLNAVEAVYDFEQDATELTLANTFRLLDSYSALKARMQTNEWAKRELVLSEEIASCQVLPGSGDPDENGTTTEWPTTTLGPTTTTTAAPGTTTTAAPGTTTTAAPTTSTTPLIVTTTTLWCSDCRDLEEHCYRIEFDGVCGDDWTGCEAQTEWSHEYPDPTGQYRCGWTGGVSCGAGDVATADLVYHVEAGWMIIVGERTWRKDVDATDYCDPEGDYTCTSGAGTATVTEMSCDCEDLITDDFNRANLGDTDWQWSCDVGATDDISANHVVIRVAQVVAAWRGCAHWHKTEICNSDHQVQVDWVGAFGLSGRWQMMVRARGHVVGGVVVAYYAGRVKKATDATAANQRDIYYWDTVGGFQTLAEDFNVVQNGTWAMRVVGTDLQWRRNGVMQLQATNGLIVHGYRHGFSGGFYNGNVGEEHQFDNYRAESL